MLRAALVIPAYNHGSRLAAVLADARQLGLPLFVVDDGSTDRTAALLAELASQPEYAELTVLRHAENRGKGAALKTAFSAVLAAGFDWALCMDADGQHRAADGSRLLAAAAACGVRPLVIGTRSGMAGEHVRLFQLLGLGLRRALACRHPVRLSALSAAGNAGPGREVQPLPV